MAQRSILSRLRRSLTLCHIKSASSCRQGGRQSRVECCGQCTQDAGGQATQSAQGAPGDAGGEARQPKRKSGWNSSGLTCSRIGISFVQRHLSKSERKQWWRITRGVPQLRTLREIMVQVYTLFDRRCRTQTALDKLAKLRRRLQRFPQVGEALKKLFSPRWRKP